MNFFNPLDALGKLVLVMVLAFLGMISYFIIQGNMLPLIATNMTQWDSSIVSLYRVFFPIALPVGFIILMLLVFFKPSFTMSQPDPYQQALQQQRKNKRNMQPPMQ